MERGTGCSHTGLSQSSRRSNSRTNASPLEVADTPENWSWHSKHKAEISRMLMLATKFQPWFVNVETNWNFIVQSCHWNFLWETFSRQRFQGPSVLPWHKGIQLCELACSLACYARIFVKFQYVNSDSSASLLVQRNDRCEVSCKISGEIMRDSLLVLSLGKAEHWYYHTRRGTSADTLVTEFAHP